LRRLEKTDGRSIVIENAFYTSEATQGKYELYDLDNFVLEEGGETLRGGKIAYRTFGKLSAAKDNAVLVTTWFSGTGKIMEDVYVGPAHASIPRNTSSSLRTRSGAEPHRHRTTCRHRSRWPNSRGSGSATTCGHNTRF
jgi:hypothetical protein